MAEPSKSASRATSSVTGGLGKTGAATRTRAHPKGDAQVLETGLIYWFYRPRVGMEHAASLADVQRFHFMLSPSADLHNPRVDNESQLKRLCVMTWKRMPTVGTGKIDRHWFYVEAVAKDASKIEREKLDEVHYGTKTRGTRDVKAVRVAGEGVYEILQHRDHTSLAYVLEVPEHIGDVQRAFNIYKEASYVISVKNPNIETSASGSRAPGLPKEQKAHYPAHLQEMFKGIRVPETRFAPVNPPEFLNHEGAEVVIMSESNDLKAEFGGFGEELQHEAMDDVARARRELHGDLTDKPFEELDLGPEHPKESLETGKFT